MRDPFIKRVQVHEKRDAVESTPPDPTPQDRTPQEATTAHITGGGEGGLVGAAERDICVHICTYMYMYLCKDGLRPSSQECKLWSGPVTVLLPEWKHWCPDATSDSNSAEDEAAAMGAQKAA